jgi:DNA polymerase I-like protein with 3'-5' exonuclease and polymerase domains
VGELRGYAVTVTGLRRYRRDTRAPATAWERNWLVNHPVQGSAADVFKAAGNRLDRLYRAYDAWLTVPIYDAFVFEAPSEHLEEVARLTERVMCEVVQSFSRRCPSFGTPAHAQSWRRPAVSGRLPAGVEPAGSSVREG